MKYLFLNNGKYFNPLNNSYEICTFDLETLDVLSYYHRDSDEKQACSEGCLDYKYLHNNNIFLVILKKEDLYLSCFTNKKNMSSFCLSKQPFVWYYKKGFMNNYFCSSPCLRICNIQKSLKNDPEFMRLFFQNNENDNNTCLGNFNHQLYFPGSFNPYYSILTFTNVPLNPFDFFKINQYLIWPFHKKIINFENSDYSNINYVNETIKNLNPLVNLFRCKTDCKIKQKKGYIKLVGNQEIKLLLSSTKFTENFEDNFQQISNLDYHYDFDWCQEGTYIFMGTNSLYIEGKIKLINLGENIL